MLAVKDVVIDGVLLMLGCQLFKDLVRGFYLAGGVFFAPSVSAYWLLHHFVL